jgi:ATP synthase protein I
MGPAPEWKSLGELTSLGMAMVVATMLGLAAGYYLDRWLGTSPWLLLLGLGFGIAAGFVLLFRSVKNLDGRE